MFGNLKNKWLKILGYYQQTFTNYSMKTHSHNNYELAFCVKGSFNYVVEDGGNEESIYVGENCFIFMQPNLPHRLLVPSSTATAITLEFELTSSAGILNFTNLIEGVGSLYKFEKSKFIVGKGDESLSTHLSLLLSSLEVANLSSQNLSIDCHLYTILHHLLQSTNSLHQIAKYKPVRGAIEYITTHLHEPITIDKIAGVVNISRSSLKQLFKECMKCSIKDYITDQRLSKAKSLLVSTNLPINEIAKNCGYNSRQSFGKIFVQKLNTSPNEYRKNYRHDVYYYKS